MRMSRRLSAYSKPLGVGLIIFLIYYLTSEPTTAVSYFLKAYFKTKELRLKFSRIDNIFGIVIISAQFWTKPLSYLADFQTELFSLDQKYI